MHQETFVLRALPGTLINILALLQTLPGLGKRWREKGNPANSH